MLAKEEVTWTGEREEKVTGEENSSLSLRTNQKKPKNPKEEGENNKGVRVKKYRG